MRLGLRNFAPNKWAGQWKRFNCFLNFLFCCPLVFWHIHNRRLEICTNSFTLKNYLGLRLTFNYSLRQVLPPTKMSFIHISSRNPLLLTLVDSHFFMSFMNSVAYQHLVFWIKNSLWVELRRQHSLTKKKQSWNRNTIPLKLC